MNETPVEMRVCEGIKRNSRTGVERIVYINVGNHSSLGSRSQE